MHFFAFEYYVLTATSLFIQLDVMIFALALYCLYYFYLFSMNRYENFAINADLCLNYSVSKFKSDVGHIVRGN